MKRFLIALTSALAVVSLNAVAHGDAKPLHGGIVQVASDLQFELVSQANGATLYVVDHGKPADTAKMSGKLTVLTGTQKSEVGLKPAGANKLEAADIKISAGSKVVASISRADGKVTTVRFSVK